MLLWPWVHIPANLDNALLRYAKDPTISYETFCSHVADAAYSDSRGYVQRQSLRTTERSTSPPNRRLPNTYRRALSLHAGTPSDIHRSRKGPRVRRTKRAWTEPEQDTHVLHVRQAGVLLERMPGQG